MLTYIIKKLKLYIYQFNGDKNSKAFIKFQKKKWSENLNHKNNGEILVDFFQNYPFIYMWAFLVNFLSKKNKL